MMKQILITFIVVLTVSGCREQKRSTIDEEIAALPDSWEGHPQFSISSNNWAMLKKVAQINSVEEKIRLIDLLKNQSWHSPEWFIDRGETSEEFVNRCNFHAACVNNLINCLPQDPKAILYGWHMKAEWTTDLEKIIAVTEKDWQNGQYDRTASRAAKAKWSFASRVRRIHQLYFKNSFGYVGHSYNVLPPDVRPIFVEQIRRDFFSRKGMMYVKKEDLPKALQDVFPSTTDSRDEQEENKRQKAETH